MQITSTLKHLAILGILSGISFAAVAEDNSTMGQDSHSNESTSSQMASTENTMSTGSSDTNMPQDSMSSTTDTSSTTSNMPGTSDTMSTQDNMTSTDSSMTKPSDTTTSQDSMDSTNSTPTPSSSDTSSTSMSTSDQILKDATLLKDVKSRLGNTTPLEVEIDNGIVKLSGSVPAQENLDSVVETVKTVNGVTEVNIEGVNIGTPITPENMDNSNEMNS